MKMRLVYRWPLELAKDIYWCFIPLVCRHCESLGICREGFRKRRKCKNGCLRLKAARRFEAAEHYSRLRKEQFDSLIAAANEEEEKRERQHKREFDPDASAGEARASAGEPKQKKS